MSFNNLTNSIIVFLGTMTCAVGVVRSIYSFKEVKLNLCPSVPTILIFFSLISINSPFR